MHHYYFHLVEGEHILPDPDGIRLPDVATVMECTRLIVHDLTTEPSLAGSDWSMWHVEVEDEQGRRVMLVSFTEALAERERQIARTQVPELHSSSALRSQRTTR